MENSLSHWIKFNDAADTLLRKAHIAFCNKGEYSETPISYKEDNKTLSFYTIEITLALQEDTSIRLNYQNKNKRDKDYKRICNLFT